MKSIKFELETITPLFLGGTDSQTPELRPPSIKGMMRFWWRAVKGLSNITELQKEEAEIFGNTEKKSPVRLKINLISEVKKDSLRNSGIDLREKYQGLGYLLYSTFMQANRQRGYYDVGTKLNITLSSSDDHIDKLRHCAAALWVAVYFGGLGTRARRGGGNLSVINIQDDNFIIKDLSFIPDQSIKTKVEMKQWIKNNFLMVKNIIGKAGSANSYSTLLNSKIYLLDGQSDYKEALNLIGERYKRYRSEVKRDIFAGPNFGFPVMHKGFRMRIISYENNNRFSERRSSSLIFKVIKVSNDLFFPVIVLLSGDLLPVGVNLREENKHNREWRSTSNSALPDNKFLTEFINKFTNKLEVIL